MTMIRKMTLKELEEYIKLAKKHKLQSMHIGEISFILREPTKRHVVRPVSQGSIDITGGMPDDETMLNWSSESAIQNPKTN
jgi:hypothetical protein